MNELTESEASENKWCAWCGNLGKYPVTSDSGKKAWACKSCYDQWVKARHSNE